MPGTAARDESRPLVGDELERQVALLRAAWAAFDASARKAVGVELRKGPRGGGRDLDKIIGHVREAESPTSERSARRRPPTATRRPTNR